ncbi:MAG: helix-turn-helix transcriptional regulator [Bosea sp.]|uniref:helix-turn-helix domain-containing protein n=1 Tax=Bosea sp. (in: a-proteobacteria) TaxID=1871050 RepID=UPI001AD4F0FD|nr:helix-turn-helix transcriptional regulator [Bosea sp. (in: a-proteobacteria)]MBN9469978.1 helix-turn-helix transcriptional regulator [Bosea sp. (in: a-proteobacteria)]
MITPAQMRAGRALLGWSQQQLAAAAKIGLASVNNYERGASDPRLSTLREARDAMAKAGVIFIEPAGGEGEGAKLASPSPVKSEGARMAKPDVP